MGEATATIANSLTAYGIVHDPGQDQHTPVDRADNPNNPISGADLIPGCIVYTGGRFVVGVLPRAGPSLWPARCGTSLIGVMNQGDWLARALRPGPAERVWDDAELGLGRASLRTAHGNPNAAWVEHEARYWLKGRASANVSPIRAFFLFIL
jgi:hypothetical protein